jgi:hypothetical protein
VRLRVALGEGDVRPEPVGENICRLAELEGSRDMLSLAVEEVSVYRVQVAEHAYYGVVINAAFLLLPAELDLPRRFAN